MGLGDIGALFQTVPSSTSFADVVLACFQSLFAFLG